MTGGPRWRLVLASGAAVLALASGCGDEKSPGEAVPALADRLDRVDQAVEAGDYADARAHLDRLVAATARADVAGEISNEQADRILDAVAAVLAGLPGEDGSEPPPTDSEPDPQSPPDVENPGEEGADNEEQDEKKDEKDEKDEDKGEDKGDGKGGD